MILNKRLQRCAFLVGCLSIHAIQSLAATVTLTSTQDTWVQGGSFANTNNNLQGVYIANTNPPPFSLVQWDLSGLPSGATITDAVMTFYSLSDYNNAFVDNPGLLNTASGTPGLDETTWTYNILKGLDTSGNPATYNYDATFVSMSLGLFNVPAHTLGAVDSAHASSADLALLNARLTMASADRYALFELYKSARNGNFQDHELSQNGGSGFGPELTLTYSVPEPSTIVPLTIGLLAIAQFRKGRRR